LRVAHSLLVCARRMARNSRWRIAVLVGLVLFGVPGCSQSAGEVTGGPAGVMWTDLVVEVRSADGVPVGGARVRIDVHYAPLLPPHPFGPISTGINGRVTYRERADNWGWVPATISVEPPTGTSFVDVVRPDSTHYGPLPALTHVVQVTLTEPEN
jgi:hypothetical protein